MAFESLMFSLSITLLLIVAFLWKDNKTWPTARAPILFILFFTPWAVESGAMQELKDSKLPFFVAGLLLAIFFGILAL